MTTETESKAAFARRIEMSRQHVGRLVQAGLPTDDRGRVKIAEALRWVEKNLVSQAATVGPDDAAALLAARVQLTRAQAQLAELAHRQKEGELMPREIARREAVAFARLVRDTILQFAARSGPEIAAELNVEPRAMVSTLDAAVRKMLIDVSGHRLPQHETNPDDMEAANATR